MQACRHGRCHDDGDSPIKQIMTAHIHLLLQTPSYVPSEGLGGGRRIEDSEGGYRAHTTSCTVLRAPLAVATRRDSAKAEL